MLQIKAKIRRSVFSAFCRVFAVTAPEKLSRSFVLAAGSPHEIKDGCLWVWPHCPLCGDKVKAGTFGAEFANQYQCENCAASINIFGVANETSFAISVDPLRLAYDGVEYAIKQRAKMDPNVGDKLAMGNA